MPSCLQVFVGVKQNMQQGRPPPLPHTTRPPACRGSCTLYPLQVRPAFLFARTHFIRRKNDLSISYSESRGQVRRADVPPWCPASSQQPQLTLRTRMGSRASPALAQRASPVAPSRQDSHGPLRTAARNKAGARIWGTPAWVTVRTECAVAPTWQPQRGLVSGEAL